MCWLVQLGHGKQLTASKSCLKVTMYVHVCVCHTVCVEKLCRAESVSTWAERQKLATSTSYLCFESTQGRLRTTNRGSAYKCAARAPWGFTAFSVCVSVCHSVNGYDSWAQVWQQRPVQQVWGCVDLQEQVQLISSGYAVSVGGTLLIQDYNTTFHYVIKLVILGVTQRKHFCTESLLKFS